MFGKTELFSVNVPKSTVVERLYVTFNGFWYGQFVKCFGIEIKNKYRKDIKAIGNVYKQNEFLDGFKRSSAKVLCVFFHYPAQFLLSNENHKCFIEDRTKRTDYMLDARIRGLEILKRRNKRKQRCMQDEANYSNSMLEQHVKNNGCKAPYQRTLESFPICSTQQEMKHSVYEVTVVKGKNYPVPCKTISKISFEVTEHQYNETGEQQDLFSIWVDFPDQIKTITQSQEVDMQVFIGNIGGYVVLFLGRFI